MGPAGTWEHGWPAEAPVFHIRRAGDRIVAQWAGLATLDADIDGRRHELILEEPARSSPRLAERMRVHADALLRHLQGSVTLHASCFARRGIAIACMGDSNAGKSTLAMQLCRHEGVALLADDATALRATDTLLEVVPTERIHWLRPDIARAMGLGPGDLVKFPMPAETPSTCAARLGAVIALSFEEGLPRPSLRPLRGVRAFEALSLAVFRFALDVPGVLRGELDLLSRLAAEVPVLELRRARDPRQLHASADPVVNLLWKLSEGAAR